MDEEVKPTTEEAAQPTPAEEQDMDDDSLPFPRARIVNLMKDTIGPSKQIRSEVKDAVNIWLGSLLRRISREMGGTQFGSVGIADFQRATKPYDMISDIVKDEERLKLSVEKLDSDAQHIIRELNRFFSVLKGSEQ